MRHDPVSTIWVIEQPEPGQVCPTCDRRMPIPKEDRTPRQRSQVNITVPKDSEDGEEILRHLIDMARERIGRPVGTPPYIVLVEALHDYLTGGIEIIEPGRVAQDESECVRCGRPSDHRHHRKRRSQGGDDSPANTVRLCFGCHEWVHRNPGDAYATGYLVRSWQDPGAIAVVQGANPGEAD